MLISTYCHWNIRTWRINALQLTKFHWRFGHKPRSSSSSSNPESRSGTLYACVPSFRLVGNSFRLLSLGLLLLSWSTSDRILLGFSKATFSRSMGSPLGTCLYFELFTILGFRCLISPIGKKGYYRGIYSAREQHCYSRTVRTTTYL